MLEGNDPSQVSAPPKKSWGLLKIAGLLIIGIVVVVLFIQNKKVNDYNGYVDEIKKISSIEESIIDKYDSVIGTNYKDDSTMYKKIQEMLPETRDFIYKLESIRPKEKELIAIHEVYISGWNNQLGAFLLMASAIETQDTAKVVEANDRITKGRALLRDYVNAMESYRDRISTFGF